MMQEQGGNWMWGFSLGHSLIGLLILAILVLGVAALIKYLLRENR
jgi:Tfp pilus assembly protein PilV